MKKKTLKNLRQTLLSHARGALFAVLFSVLAMTAYAAITYPTDPNPISGIVGMYAGATTVHDGNDATSYQGADAYCDAVVTGSHVCTPMEIMNTYNNNLSAVSGLSSILWVNTGSPIGVSPQVSDCNGWTSATAPDFGNVWNFTIDAAGIQQCNSSRGYACCK